MSIVFLPADFITILYAMDDDEALRTPSNFEVTWAFSRRLDYRPLEVSSSLHFPVLLWFFCNSLILEEAFLREKLKNLWSVLSITPIPQKQMSGFLCTYLITCSSPDCLLISFHAYLSLLIFTVCLSLCISFATLHKHGIISCIEEANQNILLTGLLF